jgi:hypothetical protein
MKDGQNYNSPTALTYDAQGGTLVAGLNTADAETVDGIGRFLPNGSLDPAFGKDGRTETTFGRGVFVTSQTVALAVQPDGKIVLAGVVVPQGQTTSVLAVERFIGTPAGR